MALLPLVTVADLAARLGLDDPVPETPEFQRLDDALRSASGEIRRVIGQPITAGSSTLRVRLDDLAVGVIGICPVRAVTSVRCLDGTTLGADEWQLDGQRLWIRYGPHARHVASHVLVDVEHGYEVIPEDLQRFTMALAAAELAALQAGNLGMTGGLQRVAVDDGNAAFNDAPITLTPRIEEQLRQQYGGIG